MIKKYEIYQLKEEYFHEYGFMSYDFLKEHDKEIHKDMYCSRYRDAEIGIECSDGEYLERLFTKFNMDRPEDFKGHSLSVSDVIILNGTPYYTDKAPQIPSLQLWGCKEQRLTSR